MQLKLSLAVSVVLWATGTVYAEDYVSIHYLGYDEESGQTFVHAPSFELNKDFGADYTLNATVIHDSVSGASPTFYDAKSGASATISGDGKTYPSNIVYGDIDYEDNRTAVSVSLTQRMEESRDAFTVGYSYSTEHDYTSREISSEYLHYLDESKNRSVTVGASYQNNDVLVPCFLGKSMCDGISGASSKSLTKKLKVYNVSLGFTQVIDVISQFKASLFGIYESGYLTSPYLRVVRSRSGNMYISPEKKPDLRKSAGMQFEYDKSWNDAFSSVWIYRFFYDDWEILSHMLEAKLYYEWSEKFTTSLYGRYYHQSAAYFYSTDKSHFADEKYATSDRRLGEYSAYTVGVSAKYSLTDNVDINLGAGYYDQPDRYSSNFFDLGVKYKF